MMSRLCVDECCGCKTPRALHPLDGCWGSKTPRSLHSLACAALPVTHIYDKMLISRELFHLDI